MTDLSPRIDAHAHVFRRDLPLAAERRYAPDYDAPLDAYLAALDETGSDLGVLVQPSFLGTDNSHLLACLAAVPARLRGIAVVDPGTPASDLAALDRAGIVGLRLNLVGRPLPDLDRPEWSALVRDAIGLGWQIEIQRSAADLAPLARRLVDRGATVVLDHWALPDSDLGIDDPGFRAVLGLGETGRAWVKLSAPYRIGPDGREVARRALPLLLDHFGPDRLMWGSDWPHTRFEATETPRRNRDGFADLVADPGVRDRILAAPRHLFRF
jgi:predicted TIM-barrel fold metal-dependent hydrolase